MVTPFNVTYDGNDHAATGVCSVGEAVLSGVFSATVHTNVGSWTDPWTFVSTDGNYAASGTAADSIGKADPTCSVTPYDVTYTGSPFTATGACTGAKSEVLLGLDLATSTLHTAAGSYSDTWTYTDATGNYTDATGTVTDVIAPATATCVVTPFNVTYDGNDHAATGVCSVGEAVLSGVFSATVHTNVGSWTDPWTFVSTDGNYAASGTAADSIGKADPTCSVTPYDVTYTGSPFTATGACTGAKSEVLLGLDLATSTLHTAAGSYSDTWTYTDATGNYTDATGTVTDVIAPATATCVVTPFNVTYDGNDHAATGVCSVGEAVLSGVFSATVHTNVGSWTDPWTFVSTDGNYAASGTAADSIGKADPTCSVTPYDVTYTGSPFTATGACTGAKSEVLLGLDLATSTLHTAAGSYSDTWTYTDATGNYTDATGTVTDVIAPATATCVVTPFNVTYDGNDHAATGVCSVGEAVLSGVFSATVHTNVGSWTDPWTFVSTDGNYAASGTAADSIGKADPTCSVTPYDVTYTGSPFTATGACTGAKSEVLLGLDLATSTLHTAAGSYSDTWTYTDATGNYTDATGTVTDVIAPATATCVVTPFNVTYDGNDHAATGVCSVGEAVLSGVFSATVHTNVGSWTDPWTFVSTDGNYAASGTAADSIGKADPTCSVTPYDVTYTGSPFTATGACTGAKSEVLLGLDLATSTLHTAAGSYSDTWTYTDATGNYTDATGTVTDVIAPATATCVVTPFNVTYDGNDHAATGVCSVGEAVLSGVFSATVHTNVGSWTDPWTFVSTDGNYAASGTAADSIGKADPTCSVTPYDVTYTGSPFTATGACTGAKSEVLLGLDLATSTLHTAAGSYSDTWTYTDATGNYTDATGTVTDVIAPATATCVVTPFNVTYDGNDHAATGVCMGLGNTDLSSGLDLSGTTHTAAGDYPTDPWTFSYPNYANQSGTVHDVIAGGSTTTTISAVTNPSVVGQLVTFTATVAPVAGSGTPTGQIQWKVDGVVKQTEDLTGGQDVFTFTWTSTGSHTIKASYLGATPYGPSNATLTQAVNKKASKASLLPVGFTTSTYSQVYGRIVSYTVTVSPVDPATGTPDGNVQFVVDGVNVGLPTALLGGTATFTPATPFATGGHTVRALYLGSGTFSPSNSNVVNATVTKAPTSALLPTPSSAAVGQSVTYIVAVGRTDGYTDIPIGSITWMIDGANCGTTPVDGTGHSQFVKLGGWTAAGTHTVRALYSGGTNYAASNSNIVYQTVRSAF